MGERVWWAEVEKLQMCDLRSMYDLDFVGDVFRC
jgi:hypothetical protein